MPKLKTPKNVTVHGRRRVVTETAPSYWVEHRLDDVPLLHVGQLHSTWVVPTALPAPKPCSVCKKSTTSATPRGRAVHPTCEGRTDVIPDELYINTIMGLAADLGAAVVSSTVGHRPREQRHAA